MNKKILSVDDSTAVRKLLKSYFAPFDCTFIEAPNGLEGLKTAAEQKPDLILLDVNMPQMNGVQMLKELRKDKNLKGTNVIMLTTECNRETVIGFVKLGVRDYIVKPFKKEMVIGKANRVLKLSEKGGTSVQEAPAPKSTSKLPGKNILVVEDKEAISSQLLESIKLKDCHLHHSKNAEATVAFCEKHVPDLIILSLSLEGTDCFALYRKLKGLIKEKTTKFFALVLQAEAETTNKAKELGFNTVITKPINFDELEAHIIRQIGIDVSDRHFSIEGDLLVIKVGKSITDSVTSIINRYAQKKIIQTIENGLSKGCIDCSELEQLNGESMKFLDGLIETAKSSGMKLRVKSSEAIEKQAKDFEETEAWEFEGRAATVSTE